MKYIGFTATVFFASQAALAQIPLGAGGQLQQIPPVTTPVKPVPDINVSAPQAAITTGPAGPKIAVGSLRLSGMSRFSESELIAATSFKPNSQLDLNDLHGLAAQITNYYNARGYFLAQAYVPAQDITGGSVTITVIEGRYGKIGLNPSYS